MMATMSDSPDRDYLHYRRKFFWAALVARAFKYLSGNVGWTHVSLGLRIAAGLGSNPAVQLACWASLGKDFTSPVSLPSSKK